jgi:NTE family protein
MGSYVLVNGQNEKVITGRRSFMPDDRVNNALVISGGGAKGAFGVGAADYLINDLGIEIDFMAGVSVGALIVPMISQGELEKAKQLFLSTGKNGIFKGSIGFCNVLYTLSLGRKRNNLLDNSPLKRQIEEHIDPTSWRIPFAVGCVDLNSGKYIKMLYDGESIEVCKYDTTRERTLIRLAKPTEFRKAAWEYILASTAIPIAFPTVVLTNLELVDGGVRDISPLGDVIRKNPKKVYIINHSTRGLDFDDSSPRGLIDVGKRVFSIGMDEILATDIREFVQINDVLYNVKKVVGKDDRQYAYFDTCLIEPEDSLGGPLEFSSEMMERRFHHGREMAKKAASIQH